MQFYTNPNHHKVALVFTDRITGNEEFTKHVIEKYIYSPYVSPALTSIYVRSKDMEAHPWLKDYLVSLNDITPTILISCTDADDLTGDFGIVFGRIGSDITELPAGLIELAEAARLIHSSSEAEDEYRPLLAFERFRTDRLVS